MVKRTFSYKNRGFTLMEVVFAVVILGIAFVPLAQIFYLGARSHIASENLQELNYFLAAHAENVFVNLKIGQTPSPSGIVCPANERYQASYNIRKIGAAYRVNIMVTALQDLGYRVKKGDVFYLSDLWVKEEAYYPANRFLYVSTGTGNLKLRKELLKR